jgi:hypothetical protein
MASTQVAGRARLRRLAVCGAALVSALALVACNGGGGNSGKTGTATAVPTERPHVQPTIDGSVFNFPARGYSATIPAGWHANPNSLLAGSQVVDTFFASDTTDGVQSNISITCEDNPANVGTDQFVQHRLNTLNSLGAKDVKEEGATTVSGVSAQKVSYTLVRDNNTIAKTDIMFATRKCGWVIASANAPSVAQQSGAVFDTFLKSFKLIDDTLS